MDEIDHLFDLVRDKKPVPWKLGGTWTNLDPNGVERLVRFLRSKGYMFNSKLGEFEYKERKKDEKS